MSPVYPSLYRQSTLVKSDLSNDSQFHSLEFRMESGLAVANLLKARIQANPLTRAITSGIAVCRYATSFRPEETIVDLDQDVYKPSPLKTAKFMKLVEGAARLCQQLS